MIGRVLILLALLLTAGCAARVPAPAAPPAPSPDEEADRLLRQGCYRCLEQAFERAQSRGSPEQAFESAILLTLRSKELGLPHRSWRERAGALATPGTSSYLDMVDAIPPDRLSQDRDALFDVIRRRRARESIATWRDQIRSGAGSEPFRAYLEVALVCAFGRLKETEESFSGAADPAALTPLVQYAIGACDPSHAERLAAVRAADPDFTDADFALGRYALEDPIRPDPEEALKRFESAAAAFPESPAIAIRIGNLHRLWEDWPPALAAFDRALAAAADHPDAIIGRAISLSHLERSGEAIEAATRLIDGGQWLLGEAYYWRGWNRLKSNDLDRARADADRARTLMSNAAVLVLSGVIEWRRGRLANAERDFQDALTIDLGECEAAFDLGVVREELEKRPEALAAFKQAGQCYDLSIALRREAIQKIHHGPGTATMKARESARHERVLADLLERRGETARLVHAIEQAQPPSIVP